MKLAMLAVAASSFLMTACQTDEYSTSAEFDALPQNVQSEVRNEIGDAQIVDIDQERRLGNWVYTVTYVGDGGPQKLEIREDGAVVSKRQPDIIEEAAGADLLEE